MILEKLRASEIAPHIQQSAAEDLPVILTEIEQGECEAWRVDQGKAYMVTRIEHPELVVVCLEGRGLRQIAPDIIARARRLGLRSIRFHTSRPGMGRVMQAFGFTEAERVYRTRLY